MASLVRTSSCVSLLGSPLFGCVEFGHFYQGTYKVAFSPMPERERLETVRGTGLGVAADLGIQPYRDFDNGTNISVRFKVVTTQTDRQGNPVILDVAFLDYEPRDYFDRVEFGFEIEVNKEVAGTDERLRATLKSIEQWL